MTTLKNLSKNMLLALLPFFMVDALADNGLPLMYLEGGWISNDYDCPSGVFRTEKIAISISGNDLKALKTDSGGDNCVPTGSDTFRGSLPSELEMGKPFPVVIILGSPAYPASGTGRAYLVMQDADSFKICLERDCNQRGYNWIMNFSRIHVSSKL